MGVCGVCGCVCTPVIAHIWRQLSVLCNLTEDILQLGTSLVVETSCPDLYKIVSLRFVMLCTTRQRKWQNNTIKLHCWISGSRDILKGIHVVSE